VNQHVFYIDGRPGCGKTHVLASLLDNVLEARKANNAFLPGYLRALLDGQRRLRAIRDEILILSEPETARPSSAWAPVDLSASLKAPISVLDKAELGNSRLTGSELLALVVSLLREFGLLIRLALSLAVRSDHADDKCLMERRWFFLHGDHPPRFVRTAVTSLSFGWVRSIQVSVF
jgi:hypothetical protein